MNTSNYSRFKCLSDFLLSIKDAHQADRVPGFSEALEKAVNFCFTDMQDESHTIASRVDAAVSGLQMLDELQTKLEGTFTGANTALTSILEGHANFIASAALQIKGPTWDDVRVAAQKLLRQVFQDDCREILQSVLGLATIAMTERRRLKRKSRSKQSVPAPVPVTNLHRAVVHRELWSASYSTMTGTDVEALALIMTSVAPFAHLESLDRLDAWHPKDLREVVKADDWIASIRAVNLGLKVSREGYAKSLKTIAAQPDPTIMRSLWLQPGVPQAATVLLLSPADNLHEPVLNLIQQSFDDVDDRGDCFRVLLERFPIAAMDGLSAFLSSFIQTASLVPEACSLAKWLVRCFTDVLDALCQQSGSSPPLLQSESFMSSFDQGKWMALRVGDLWQLMTDSLALIFKRTSDWAPYYDNEVMVDWMRDALVFGRSVTEHIRVFETAILSRTKAPSGNILDSPIKMTQVGKGLVQKLEVVLTDLVGWLRLTDSETLHQTYELIKTILGRIAKSKPDLAPGQKLEIALMELEKFCRRASSSYNCRLSDDLLSELSDMLSEFDLPLDGEDIQFVKTVNNPSPDISSEPESVQSRLKKAVVKSEAPRQEVSKLPPKPKNAFDMMMKKAGEKHISTGKSSAAGTYQRPITLEEFEDDTLLDSLSSYELDNLERRAQATSSLLHTKSKTPTSASAPSAKLNINVVPKYHQQKTGPASSFTSKFMRDASRDHRLSVSKTKRAEIGVPRLPVASGLGSGLGAFQGPRKEEARTEHSDSSDSASSSSDDEATGIAALISRQRSPVKQVASFVERRPIKVLGASMADILKEREDKRAKAHAIKQRLRPDIGILYRNVLAWDPDHNGSLAPHPPKNVPQLGRLQVVPTTFRDCQQYESIMLPLFLQELWAQFLKGEPSSSPLTVEITTRAYEDDFLDIDVVVPGNLPLNFFVNDTDIVILRQEGPARPVFAKVQAFRKKFKESAIKLRILTSMDQKELGSKSKWILRKHVTLSTAVREFAALRGLPYYEPLLLTDILAARSAVLPQLSSYQIDEAMKTFAVNEPQAKAILGSFSVNGFALIQGPPGTGKTKTISGLVGKFLSERKAFVPVNGQAPPKAKLLVCAPSNAAIDEVCKRLMDGVPDSNSPGMRLHPNIVRIGIDSSVNIAVKDVSLDSIVEARVNADVGTTNDGSGGDYSRIQNDLDEVKRSIKEKQDMIQQIRDNDQQRKVIEAELHVLNTRRTQLGQASSKAKDAARDSTRHLEGARRAARDAVLKEADIICATLSGAGQESLAPYTFETVIIDEAAQAIEMSCLIPLKYGCKRCIMVGDPNQLPPTTFSSEAEANKFNQSLFVRIAQQKSSRMHLLSIQYRMNPFISELPSKVFYNGKLEDGPGMAKKTMAVWHQRAVFGPYRFFNVQGTEMKAGTSTKNPQEALVAIELYRALERDFGNKVNLSMRIGVITMYKEQLNELKRQFRNAFGSEIIDTIEFNTVDGFQGQEKDIIILSCVRSGPNLRSIGFLRDFRRMNVALTRAKSSLFVIGNATTLERSDERWKIIVGDARDRGFLIDYNSTTFSEASVDLPRKNSKKDKHVSTDAQLSTRKSSSAKPPSHTVLQANQPKRKSPEEPPAGSVVIAMEPMGNSSVPSPPEKPTALAPPSSVYGPSKAGNPHRIVPPIAPRKAEDVLFIKKKKKPNKTPARGSTINVRSSINGRISENKNDS